MDAMLVHPICGLRVPARCALLFPVLLLATLVLLDHAPVLLVMKDMWCISVVKLVVVMRVLTINGV